MNQLIHKGHANNFSKSLVNGLRMDHEGLTREITQSLAVLIEIQECYDDILETELDAYLEGKLL